MSFHQHRKQSEEWRAWVRKHGERLARWGIPDEAYRTQLDWGVFLDHGYVQSDTKRRDDWWHIGWLKPAEANELRDFLTEEYGDAYADLMARLTRVASGPRTDLR
jgi:hypothetical protein